MIKIKKFYIFLAIFCLMLVSSGRMVKGMTEEQINQEIKELNQEIKESKEKMESIAAEKEQYAKNIKTKQNEVRSLNNQLSILDNRIAKAELDVKEVKNQINEATLEIRRTEVEIEAKENDIEKEKKNISNVLKLLYREGDASALEILLMNDSLSEFLSRAKYLEDINSEMNEALEKLKQLKKDLENKKDEQE
jgi:peptidoglycan hydrolase CwlO-like protein